MRVVELVMNDENDGVHAISLVDRPAIEENWIALSKEYKIEFKEIEEKKNILLGAVLIPDFKIPRIDEKTQEVFEIFFSAKTIEKVAHQFMKQGNQSESTINHSRKIDGVSVVETWLKEDFVHDKSVKYGFDYPLKTWLVAVHVENEEIKKKVKTGEIKGFSIEGFFMDKLELKKHEDLINQIIKVLENGG